MDRIFDDGSVEILSVEPVEGQDFACVDILVDGFTLFITTRHYEHVARVSNILRKRCFSDYMGDGLIPAPREIACPESDSETKLLEISDREFGLLHRTETEEENGLHHFTYSEFVDGEIRFQHPLFVPATEVFMALGRERQPYFAYLVDDGVVWETNEGGRTVAELIDITGIKKVRRILAFDVDQFGTSYVSLSARVDGGDEFVLLRGGPGDWRVESFESLLQPHHVLAFQVDEDALPRLLVFALVDSEWSIVFLHVDEASGEWISNRLPDGVDTAAGTGVFDAEGRPHVVYTNGEWIHYATLSEEVGGFSQPLREGIGSVKLMGRWPEENGNWWWSPNFGYLSTIWAPPWVYHQNLGWVYWFGPGKSKGVYLYDQRRGWLWTSAEALPWIFSFSTSQWFTFRL